MMSSAVPSLYPVDEELIKLYMLDKLLNLGLAEQFTEEIQDTLAQIYRYIMFMFFKIWMHVKGNNPQAATNNNKSIYICKQNLIANQKVAFHSAYFLISNAIYAWLGVITWIAQGIKMTSTLQRRKYTKTLWHFDFCASMVLM